MQVKVLKNRAEYNAAMQHLHVLLDVEPPEDTELANILIEAIPAYSLVSPDRSVVQTV